MPVGLFGKYPGRRDFITLNLPREVLAVIEPWLQDAITISRRASGRQWQEYYFIHPIWNFRLGSSIIGSDCIGAIMPSVDGVGRFFPLCMLAHAPSETSFPLYGQIPANWIEELHAQLLSALSENDVPDPEMLLSGMSDPTQVEYPAGMEMFAGGYEVACDEADDIMLARITAAEALVAARTRSQFWTKGGKYVQSQFLSFDGMPDPELYTHMIGGAPKAATHGHGEGGA